MSTIYPLKTYRQLGMISRHAQEVMSKMGRLLAKQFIPVANRPSNTSERRQLPLWLGSLYWRDCNASLIMLV